MLCESLPCALSGSSLSSDIATQVTCIVFEQCPSKFSSFGCCHLFPPFWRSCFSFLTHSLSLVSLPLRHKCVNGQVSKDKCPSSFKFNLFVELFFKLYKLRYTFVSHRVSAKPTAWKRGCGDEYHRKFRIFKKKRECACLQGFTVHGQLHTSHMAASVGPKAQ